MVLMIGNRSFAQTVSSIRVHEQYIPLKKYVNEKEVKINRAKQNFSYLYKINNKKDSVLFYDVSNKSFNKVIPISFTLQRGENDHLKLLIQEKDSMDSLDIFFSEKSKSITVNKDIYFLNSLYYEELKKSIYTNSNVLDLGDFLDDNLGDYPYQLPYLLKISSNKKYKNNNLKITSAKLFTTRTQSGMNDIWNVKYNYDKKGNLLSVIKKSEEEEIAYEKRLSEKKGTKYKYKIDCNVESRFNDKSEIIFDTDKNTYNIIQSHFQFGTVTEETSQMKRTYNKL